MTSFDGSQIRMHWYPLDHEAPTVMMGPGWGEAGATETSGTGLFGDSPISALQQEGYHVLTWDPRGFGVSTGTITTDFKDAEARDVQLMMDWLATQKLVQLDGTTDPRVGMVGGSYGGGIQLVTAAIDCRIDAIVPTIAWHSLATSLNKAATVKIGWSNLLYTTAAGRNLDPHITSAYKSAVATGVISPADRAWFISRGPGALINQITAPTLFIQGTVDTLFTLDEAVTNYEMLRQRGVPTAMLWYCGGHGVCLTDAGDANRSNVATAAWLKRWLQRDTTVDTGPRVSIIDQHGTTFTAADLPLVTGTPLTADGAGTLPLTADGGSGPATATKSASGPIDAIALGITPAKATNSVNVKVTATAAGTSASAPKLTITYAGTSPAGDRPTRVFAQLVDDTTGLVLGNQVTPIAVVLDGKPHTVTVPLEMISHTFASGESVTLQLVASTVAYAPPRFGGSVDFTKIHVALPMAKGLRP
jgi:ABC-2 type transport system ATP-binding protein